MTLTFAFRSDTGLEREENQDFQGHVALDHGEFFIVCDGMGGHAGGSIASTMAVEAIIESLRGVPTSGDLGIDIQRAISDANVAVHAFAQKRRDLRGMGTTVVVLAIDADHERACVAHVGDSRVYLLRGNTFERLTKDHTMVQRLVDDGIISAEAAEHHPNSNVISRSLGGRPEVDVELYPTPITLESGDIFVLCSDGLTGLVSERDIALVVATQDEEPATQSLVDLANQGGGPDNITVQLVRVGERTTYEEDIPTFEIKHPPTERGRNVLITPSEGLDAVPDAAGQIPRPGTPLDEIDAPTLSGAKAKHFALLLILTVVLLVLVALIRFLGS